MSTAAPNAPNPLQALTPAHSRHAERARTGQADDDQAPVLAYRRHADQDREAQGSAPARCSVAVVGAGPVGLALAIDLAQRGLPVVLLDHDDTLATGSRAICFAKRTLEIFDRLGCGGRVADRGIAWDVGKVFFRDAEIYRFDLLAEPGHGRPAFVNLPQCHVERYLVERALALPAIDLRWKSDVVALEQHADHAVLTVATPDGRYRLTADHVVACDGSRSTLRRLVGQESRGRVFRDRFLIADVRMQADFPAERWFWFDPPFHRGQSVLLHMQPDGVWRIDFQLGWDADPERERRPENIVPRVRALLAASPFADAPFELVWASVYTFACTRMARFRDGRVLFAGDAAHGVSPFGARGANSGVQDADNLGWKLAAVLESQAGDALLDSYAAEREFAADENILHSTRSTDFITPKTEISRLFRDAVLDLAREHRFARTLVNSGRLSTATTLDRSPLNTPDAEAFDGAMRPGAAALDAPVRYRDGRDGWLLGELGGHAFTLMVGVAVAGDVEQLVRLPAALAPALRILGVVLVPAGAWPRLDVRDAERRWLVDDRDGRVAERYDLRPGTAYLFRPDQHVAARWRAVDADRIRSALARALARAAQAAPEPVA